LYIYTTSEYYQPCWKKSELVEWSIDGEAMFQNHSLGNNIVLLVPLHRAADQLEKQWRDWSALQTLVRLLQNWDDLL
jgi:hypothetical protein